MFTECQHTDIVDEGDIRMVEGHIVENLNVTLSQGGEKKHGECVKGIKEKHVPPQTDFDRVATSSKGVHMLLPCIEKDVVVPTTHCIALPSHSLTSQQVNVSYIHKNQTKILSATYSEFADIKIDRPQSQPRPSIVIVRTSSLEIFAYTSFPRTRSLHTSIDSLSGTVGTSIVASTSHVSQGLEGSPVTTTSLPIVNTGSMVTSTIGSTGSLSSPSLLLTPNYHLFHQDRYLLLDLLHSN